MPIEDWLNTKKSKPHPKKEAACFLLLLIERRKDLPRVKLFQQLLNIRRTIQDFSFQFDVRK